MDPNLLTGEDLDFLASFVAEYARDVRRGAIGVADPDDELTYSLDVLRKLNAMKADVR